LSDAEKDEAFHDADEIKTARNEAPIPTGRLRELLNHLNITTHPEFRIKRVPRPGREEYTAIMEIFSGPNVLSRHKGPAFKATYQDAVVDAAWQAITTYNRRYHEELKNTVYHLLPQRKKNKFKTSGVKADVPKMLMVTRTRPLEGTKGWYLVNPVTSTHLTPTPGQPPPQDQEQRMSQQ
jgi:hypothetical protein